MKTIDATWIVDGEQYVCLELWGPTQNIINQISLLEMIL